MELVDLTALWNAGGPVAVGFGIVAAAFIYDRRKPEHKPEKDATSEALAEISTDLKSLRHEVTDRLARVETRLDGQQQQINRGHP